MKQGFCAEIHTSFSLVQDIAAVQSVFMECSWSFAFSQNKEKLKRHGCVICTAHRIRGKSTMSIFWSYGLRFGFQVLTKGNHLKKITGSLEFTGLKFTRFAEFCWNEASHIVILLINILLIALMRNLSSMNKLGLSYQRLLHLSSRRKLLIYNLRQNYLCGADFNPLAGQLCHSINFPHNDVQRQKVNYRYYRFPSSLIPLCW